MEKAREEVVNNRRIWAIKKPNWYKNYAKKEAARCKESSTCKMAAKGIKKLERIYKNKWMNSPADDHTRCLKRGLCRHGYVGRTVAPVRLALRKAMWRVATNFNPELPACDAFFFKRQEDFIHRIVAGDCDYRGPYDD